MLDRKKTMKIFTAAVDILMEQPSNELSDKAKMDLDKLCDDLNNVCTSNAITASIENEILRMTLKLETCIEGEDAEMIHSLTKAIAVLVNTCKSNSSELVASLETAMADIIPDITKHKGNAETLSTLIGGVSTLANTLLTLAEIDRRRINHA